MKTLLTWLNLTVFPFFAGGDSDGIYGVKWCPPRTHKTAARCRVRDTR